MEGMFGRLSVYFALGAVLFALLITGGSAFSQGSLCGTVFDSHTSQGISGATVFLYESNGPYAGLFGITDDTGFFCIHDVPTGTYDLQVRVADHQIGFLADVEIPDTTSDVEIAATLPPFSLSAPWPNPASESVFFRLRMDGASPFRLKVFDLRGRLVKGWYADASAGELSLRWDFRDSQGRDVPAGKYLVRMEVGDRGTLRTLTRLR